MYILCAQLTRDLFAIAKFLLVNSIISLLEMTCSNLLVLHFYLLYLLLNSCDENDTFWRHSMLAKQWSSQAPLAGNTEIYLSRSESAKQLTIEFVDNLSRNKCTLYKHLSQQQPATWSSASLTHGEHHKTSQNVIDKAVGQCRMRLRASMRQKLMTSLWTPVKRW